MAIELKLPRLGQGMEFGTIVRWLRSEGDHVERGEPLYEVDTDKVSQEVEADVSGVLLKINVPRGEVAVGRTVAYIGQEGESVPDDAPEPAGEIPHIAVAPSPLAPQRPSGREGRVSASPRARRIAGERGLDIAAVTGSGPGGRIVAGDLDQAAVTVREPSQVGPSSARTQVEARPLTTIRRTIARRLTEAWQVPAFQLSRSIDMASAQALLARRHELEPDVHATLTDLLAKVCAVALMRHPDVNVEYTEDALLVHPEADVGIAVATQRGLVVPVIRQADRRTLAEIAAVRAGLVERARAATLEAADLEGGSFTISNLGMFAVEQFTAVLNPPQAMILAVGATQDRVVAVDGNPAVRPMMTVVLTVDHRAVDGAQAAAFLQTVTKVLQEPGLAL